LVHTSINAFLNYDHMMKSSRIVPDHTHDWLSNSPALFAIVYHDSDLVNTTANVKHDHMNHKSNCLRVNQYQSL
jgi:hypothetical protein